MKPEEYPESLKAKLLHHHRMAEAHKHTEEKRHAEQAKQAQEAATAAQSAGADRGHLEGQLRQRQAICAQRVRSRG